MMLTTASGGGERSDRETIRLLLVEDNPGDARLVEAYLEGGLGRDHELVRADTLAEGLRQARGERPDLVLLDLGLPDAAGLEGLRRMRELRQAPPVVVLTGLDDEEVAIYALGEGAQDYLVKDALDAAQLGRTVRYSLERSRVARELERTREAAEAHRALSRSILRSLPDHIAVVDADGVIVGTNEAWRRFAREQGGDAGSYEGESYLEATRRAAEDGDDDAARMLEGLREVLAGEREELALEYPCHGPETRRWFRVSVTPLRDAPGRGAVISHIDVTGRVQAETRLEEERSRLSEVFRQAPAWMATSRGPDHVFEMANPAYRRLVGDREIVGRTVREVLPELEGEGYFEMLDRVYRTGEAVEVEEMPLRLEREKGGVETKYVTFVYQPRREDGEVVGVLAHGVDVTEQVTAREAVEAAEELWSTVFETVPVGIVISGTSTGRIHAVNDTLAGIAGHEVDEMVGRTSSEIGFWEDPARREEIVAKVLEEGAATDEEAWLRSRTDGRRRAELSVRRLELAGEDRLLWAVQDVTEHVDRQRALEERTRELGERVKEQSCLYDVSRLLHDDGRSMDDRLRAVAERIPAGWQHPAATSVRIELGDAVFGHGELAGAAVLDAPIQVEGETVGRVQVGYREERPEEDLGPFLVEERRLLDEIADRIGSEVAQHRARREIERLVRTMTEAVVIVAPDGRITFANPAAERLLDLATSELADRTYDAPDWRITDLEGNEVPSEQLPFHRVRATGRPVQAAEHVVERGDGERIVVSVNAAPIEDGSGRFEGVVASLRDVTEERRRERELRESEARFRTLFEKSLDPIVVTTAGGEFVAANDAYRELFGYEADDLAAMEVAEIYADPGDRERFLAAMESEGGVTDFEAELLTRGGEVRVCRVSSAPLDDAADGDRRFQTILHDVTDRRRLEEELRHRALHDELTGLPNRSLFTDRLEQATARAERRNQALGVLMVDLDRFKRINDSLGHTAGDRVLQEVARRLREAVRAEDTVARWGGDEFAVILAELSGRRDLETVEERIQRSLGRLCTVGGEEIEIGASIGGVVHGDGDGSVRVEGPGELIRYADAALLRAKGGGTTSFHLFDADRDGRQIDILRREQDLRRGLEAGELEPFYQPIVDLETGRVWGVEPLARWRHPEKGLIGPADFIPLAEETGLIHRLGHAVCSRAFRDAARWSEELGTPVRVTPNISGRQFEDETVVDGLRDCLATSGLEPGRVHLEVTETAIMRATGRIEELRELGLRVHIDDFGTGYSSLVYLRDLEVDGLKIDMSFVRGLGEGRGNSAIVRTILTLSRELGLDVVAEGIETGDQLRRLREMGCGLGQGFLFARPMPAGELAELLADGSVSTGNGQDGRAA